MSDSAERTTITLPRELARRLTAEARSADRSVSAVVRQALEAYFAAQRPPELPSFAGSFGSGRRDTSQRAEELIRARFRKKRP